MTYRRLWPACATGLLTALVAGAALAQTPEGMAFQALPSTGVTCSVSPATNDLKRGGIWQMAQIEAPGRMVEVALDARQRPRFLSDMGRAASRLGPVDFDSTGAIVDHPVHPTAFDSSRRAPTAEEKARARLLAADAVRRCSPLPRIVGLGEPVPPAEHTTVLQEIPADRKRTCAPLRVDPAAASRGIAKRLTLSTAQPLRVFAVDLDSAGRPRALSAMVKWGALQRSETETAAVTFDVRGGAHGDKMLGYAGPDGRGATYSLSSAELASARSLAHEVVSRCAH
ncbi:MAG TPA: hypothetical protein VMH39_11390 [Gemmatimonadaceae bacterium]|nr:hypothetical protein [Gemmatimonadaceae bacterium]